MTSSMQSSGQDEAETSRRAWGRADVLFRAVRRRAALRQVVQDGIAGAVVSGSVALIGALIFPSLPRFPALAVLAIGPAIGLMRARRRAPTEEDLALFVDRRLAGGDAIVTAVGLRGVSGALADETRRRAEETLLSADPKRLRLTLLRPARARFVFAALCWICALVGVPHQAAEGSKRDRVEAKTPAVLARIESLRGRAEDPSQRARIDRAADQAQMLREKLAEGMERREALDRMQSLREELTEAQRGAAIHRRARDAAADAMAEEAAMARALRSNDMAALDREVDRAAARRETQDRARARASLENAARAAEQAGNAALARALRSEARRLDARAEQVEIARNLAASMPELASEEMQRALDKLASDGDASSLDAALANATAEAWNRLSAEERQRLADAMRNAQPTTRGETGDPSNQSRDQPMTADDIERQLRDALAGLDRLQVQVSRTAMAAAQAGQGTASPGNTSENGQGENGRDENPSSFNAQGGSGQASKQGGSSRGGGPGPRGGHTDPVDPEGAQRGPLARVRTPIGAGSPSLSTFEWTTPSGAPTRVAAPTEAAGATPANDLRSIETDPVPADYRDHVRRFFGGDPTDEGAPTP